MPTTTPDDQKERIAAEATEFMQWLLDALFAAMEGNEECKHELQRAGRELYATGVRLGDPNKPGDELKALIDTFNMIPDASARAYLDMLWQVIPAWAALDR